jgi:hypothetical protein
MTCGACAPYSQGHLFGVAEQALRAQTNLPPAMTIGSMKDAEFFVGKNAACVYVPVEYTEASGNKRTGNYIVWLKRICTRWELDRCEPESNPPGAKPKMGS